MSLANVALSTSIVQLGCLFRWFVLKVTTVFVGSEPFPCLQFHPGPKSSSKIGYVSVCVLWELLLNLFIWTVHHCSTVALLIQFHGFDADAVNTLSPVDVTCHQLLQLIQHLYGYDAGDQQLCHIGRVHRRTVEELRNVVVSQGNPFNVWLTALRDGDALLQLLNDR